MSGGRLLRDRFWDPIFLFGVALVLRWVIVLWAWERVPPTADGAFYHVVAERIAGGLGYTWLWPDGAVTYAAHYPVGYPAMMAPFYGAFGPVPGVVMLANALLGALAVGAAYEICFRTAERHMDARFARAGAGLVCLLLAVSPTLISYTPALMTEGAVLAFVVFAARAALAASGAPKQEPASTKSRIEKPLLGGAVLFCLTAATYLRPQCILLAPVVGFYFVRTSTFRRALVALGFGLATLLCVLPWTLRNCDKMEHCVFVSANGGWNLLIGTFAEGKGAWVALDGERVPVTCREVFQEAEKDACFNQAARQRILLAPSAWLKLISAKWRATFDHTAAGAEHLAAAGALSDSSKRVLTFAEFFSQRLGFMLGLLGAFLLAQRGIKRTNLAERTVLAVAFALGTVGFLGLSAALGWGIFCALALVSRQVLRDVGLGLGVASVLLTALVHAVFFGAGRYSLPLLVWTAPFGALGVGLVMEAALSRRVPWVRSGQAEDFDTSPSRGR